MGVRIQELPETTGINKEDVLIVEDGQGTKKGTVQQLDETLGVSQLKEDLGNKIDITWKKDYYVGYLDGLVIQASGYYASQYINVSNINKLFYKVKSTSNDYSGYAFMDKNWNFVSGNKIYNNEHKILEVPSNAVYFGITTNDTSLSYVEILDLKHNIEKECKQQMVSTNVTPNNKGYISSTNGYFSQYDRDIYYYTDVIELRCGESIFVRSTDISSTSVGRIVEFDEKGNFIKTIVTGTKEETYYTYTPTENKVFIRVCVDTEYNYQIKTYKYPFKEYVQPIKYTSFGCYKSMGIIGDSYASGETRYGDTWHDNYWQSWGQVLSRFVGNKCTNFSSGGQTTRSWLTSPYGLQLLESSEPCDIYICALGINDTNELGEEYLGTINDMTDNYENNPDTFYGNYGKIIGNILKKNPNATIVLSSIALHGNNYDIFSNAIKEIANKAGVVFLDTQDSDFFNSSVFINSLKNGHPNNQTYAGMAYAYEELFNNEYPNYIDYLNEKYNGYIE